MKYLRWISVLLLLVCIFKSFEQRPFFKDLPMLLLPEQTADIALKRADCNAFEDVLDPRPICIQTKNNFSCFSHREAFAEGHILSRLEIKFLSNGAALLKDKIILNSPKEASPHMPPVWVQKHLLPKSIDGQQKAQDPTRK